MGLEFNFFNKKKKTQESDYNIWTSRDYENFSNELKSKFNDIACSLIIFLSPFDFFLYKKNNNIILVKNHIIKT